MAIVIGVDVGGTFTDVVLFDDTRGVLRAEKLLSTPSNPAEGFPGIAVPPLAFAPSSGPPGSGAGFPGGARGKADLAGRPPPQQRWR